MHFYSNISVHILLNTNIRKALIRIKRKDWNCLWQVTFVLTDCVEVTTLHFEYNILKFIFVRLFCVLLCRFIRALNLGDFTSSLEDQIHVGFCYNYNCHPQYNTRAVSLLLRLLASFVSVCACAPCWFGIICK